MFTRVPPLTAKDNVRIDILWTLEGSFLTISDSPRLFPSSIEHI
jgi:hypothetical protein